MQNGKVVGVAFQGYRGDVAQGVAYMIPTPVIKRFLQDIGNGHYDEYPDLAITYAKLQNPAQRRFLGLKDDDRGVVVSSVVAAGPSNGILYPGDVLLAIDGHPIASDANVELDGEHAQFEEVVERKFKGDSVKLDVLRNKQPTTVSIKLYKPWPYSVQGHSYDVRPRYVLYGGLLFQPLNLDLVEAYRPTDLRLRHFFEYFVLEQLYLQHPDVIVLTNILPDPINTYLAPYRGGIVDEINGKKIRTLDELAKAFTDSQDRLVIRMIGDGPPLVLDRKQVEAARERIMTRYNVLKEQNLEEQPASKPAEKTFLDGITPLEIAPDTVVGDRLAAWQLEPSGALLATEGLVTTVQMMPYPIDLGEFLTYRVSIPMQYRENSYTVPLVKNNKLAGLLLRYDSRSQLLDAIPAPVITHFLKDAESQNYRGFPSAGFSFFPTRDPALRQFSGEKGKDAGGVYVTNVEPGTPAMKAGLQVGDIVTAVANNEIDQNGNY